MSYPRDYGSNNGSHAGGSSRPSNSSRTLTTGDIPSRTPMPSFNRSITDNSRMSGPIMNQGPIVREGPARHNASLQHPNMGSVRSLQGEMGNVPSSGPPSDGYPGASHLSMRGPHLRQGSARETTVVERNRDDGIRPSRAEIVRPLPRLPSRQFTQRVTQGSGESFRERLHDAGISRRQDPDWQFDLATQIGRERPQDQTRTPSVARNAPVAVPYDEGDDDELANEEERNMFQQALSGIPYFDFDDEWRPHH